MGVSFAQQRVRHSWLKITVAPGFGPMLHEYSVTASTLINHTL